MKIIYITDQPLSAKGAAMQRAKLFAEGLGDSKIIYIPSCTRFLNHFGLIGRIVDNIIQTPRLKKKLKNLGAGDYVVFYGQHATLRLSSFLRKRGVKIIAERTEFPYDLITENADSTSVKFANIYRKSLNQADYFITCSEPLKKYYSCFTDAKMIILPLILDFEKLQKYVVKDIENNYTIAYCGDMGNNKDGLSILIEAFKIASQKNDKIKLLLMGDSSTAGVLDNLKALVKRDGLENRVTFTGRIPHEEVLSQLAKSALCVLARPANKQAEGGIPSKMGEYLGLGRPTLMTKVGDIPKLLTDRGNVFLCEPDSAKKFAESILYIFNNYELANTVARKGREDITKYDYKAVAQQLKNYLINDVQR